MLIRTAKYSDKDKIIDFQMKMAWETEGLELNPELVNKGVENVLNDPSKGVYYVFEFDDNVVASLLITYEWSDWRNGTVLWIQSVYVLPQFRGQGIYKKMYHYLKEKIKNEPGLLGLRLYVEKNNINAQSVYSKLGMNGDHYQMFEWFG
ncbi:MAG: GNAT family N-acetyltransferase [Bacteroidales bacterium]